MEGDSLARNGFRMGVVTELTGSTLEGINQDFLLKTLGKPTSKQTYTSYPPGNLPRQYASFQYAFYCDEENRPNFYACLYLEFLFDAEKNILVKMETGKYCPF